jgi:putative sigma-54 modulation protein
MEFKIRGKNIKITDGLKSSVEKKLEKLDRYFSDDTAVSVALGSEKNEFSVEITIPVYGKTVRVEKTGKDMYALIDSAVDIMERRLRKYKNQLVAKREGHPTSHKEANHFSDGFIHTQQPDDDQAESEESFVPIRVKRFEMKPMHPEDAVFEMELSDHDFYVFTNAETGEVNVVYKRAKGGYGLIEPELV